jgi:hypothetical protein
MARRYRKHTGALKPKLHNKEPRITGLLKVVYARDVLMTQRRKNYRFMLGCGTASAQLIQNSSGLCGCNAMSVAGNLGRSW